MLPDLRQLTHIHSWKSSQVPCVGNPVAGPRRHIWGDAMSAQQEASNHPFSSAPHNWIKSELSSMLKVKMYPAKNGDALLVSAFGTHILVDAGYGSTFDEHIAPDLKHLSGEGHRLDLLICTHIDRDHIAGIIEFISANGPSGARSVIDVSQVWHNSLRSLSWPAGKPDSTYDRQVLEAIRKRGFPLPRSAGASANTIGAKQGSSLARLLRDHNYRWNDVDGTTPVTSDRPPEALANGVLVHLLGPTKTRLEELRAWWLREMRRLSYKGTAAIDTIIEDAYEMVCASARQHVVPTAKTISSASKKRLRDVYVADDSLTNGSSIVAIVEGGAKRLLLLGDAWAEDIAAELRRTHGGDNLKLFDAIKVSHHGSLRNTSVDLLSLIDAPLFLISTNGSGHDHPDFEVLAEIVDRPAAFERIIYFNYETPASTRLKAHVSRSGARFNVRITQNDWIQV